MEVLDGLGPYFLMFGKAPNLPLQNKLDLGNEKEKIDRIGELQKLEKIREKIPKWVEKHQNNQKLKYDKGREEIKFEVGEKILLKNPLQQGKFNLKFLGPFEILKQISNKNYLIKYPIRGKMQEEIVHVRRMRKFNEQNN